MHVQVIPTQLRYLSYVSWVLDGRMPSTKPITLDRVIMHGSNNPNNPNSPRHHARYTSELLLNFHPIYRFIMHAPRPVITILRIHRLLVTMDTTNNLDISTGIPKIEADGRCRPYLQIFRDAKLLYSTNAKVDPTSFA
jgi:hypothetical protein